MTVLPLTPENTPEPQRVTVLLAFFSRRCEACDVDAPVGASIPVDDTFTLVEATDPAARGMAFTCGACARAFAEGGLRGLGIRLEAIEEQRRRPRVAPVIGEAHA